ncbi:hypothetical protein OKC48_07480 [Methylorubrum extorquens]|uniref:hypothetical protein n=1 Tax=Methylorubrum extorquens TaxID=408 RepID=UPI002237D5A5|nr:hypothetical protein [Methylorubrum extorquens]UYW28347.1 hypothetical protein OKC48_07480 [Methylorubrum extorquens]
MTRREYIWDVWFPEHATWLLLASAVMGGITATDTPGFIGSTFAWFGASSCWFWFLVALRYLTWRPWRDERRGYEPPRMPEEASGENVVPLRPPPPTTGSGVPPPPSRDCTERSPLGERSKLK